MLFLIFALIVLMASGLLALAAGKNARLACLLGPAGAVGGGVLALMAGMPVLLEGKTVSLQLAWNVPLGSFYLRLDPLAAMFVLPIAVVTGLAAIYGGQYLHAYEGRNLGVSWAFFNVLTASMLVVVTASNGVLFLAAWEVMTLASFFLVMFEDQREEVRRAGWTYLVASHLGTAFLLALFAILAGRSGTLDFDTFTIAPGLAGLAFLLAVVGFGTKAGFVPLHVWLPEAHPAAPSHVSAVMSGVMIKMGIYGLVRTLTLLGPVPEWCGWLLVIVGAVSGILGVLFALAQHDLKRLLAYHSVENIGIIALGLGVGMLGLRHGNPTMAALGFAGALLHVVNHALFKSLLFLGAGAVLHACGTRDLDHLGGLLKRMPTTGLAFLVGAAAISGLPPLNGFVSELLIYLGAFSGLTAPGGLFDGWPVACLTVIGSLALIGGLAAACFTKAFGVVFLGEPRSKHAEHAHECGRPMRIAMLALAAGCVVIGLGGGLAPQVIGPAVAALAPAVPSAQLAGGLAFGSATLGAVGVVSVVLVGMVVLLSHARRRLLAGRPVEEGATWDCGYAAPSPRMQYTASSFAHPLVAVFHGLLRTREEIHAPEGLFPAEARLHSETPDVFHQRLFVPLFASVRWGSLKLRWLQQGRIQLYVLYIAVTLLALLIWFTSSVPASP